MPAEELAEEFLVRASDLLESGWCQGASARDAIGEPIDASSAFARRVVNRGCARAGVRLPSHVAVILDGNRRWASLVGLSEPSAGHRAGADKLDELLDWCVGLGVEQVTVWGLSNENLGRPSRELAPLLQVVADKLEALAALHGAQSMRIRVFGRLQELPERLRRSIRGVEAATAENDGLRLNIVLGYSGRDELVDASRALVRRLAAQGVAPEAMPSTSPQRRSQPISTRPASPIPT